MLIGVYSALLGLGLLVSAPWWLTRMATTQRYREGLRERLGKVPSRLRAAVAGRRVIWVHAVSVGEVLAVSWLVQELETALNHASDAGPEPWRVVVSTTTRTGQALARERFGDDRVFYFPLDFAWAVRAYLRALQPSLLILAESELWPRMLHECERAHVPAAVVNARVSDRSFRRGMRVRAVWRCMLRKVTLWLAQSEEDARRLVAMGARADAVQVSGNLKYDVRAPLQSRIAQLIRSAVGQRPIIVAGSTAEGEDEVVIRSFYDVWAAVHDAFLIVAPRHPERFSHVLELAEDFGAVRATSLQRDTAADLLKQAVRNDETGTTYESRTLVVVLDTIGDLASVYGIADVAFVGGSLIAGRGGQNPLEPAQFGVPVVMGSSYENFRDVVEKMRAEDAIRVLDAAGQMDSVNAAKEAFDPDKACPLRDDLSRSLVELLRDRQTARAIGERGRQVFEQEGGATARSIEALMPLVNVNPVQAPEAVPA